MLASRLSKAHRQRLVRWDGFHNARDLGGLPTRTGGRTRFGEFYRSATVQLVPPAGWQQARRAGVRTVVDLRNDDEVPDVGRTHPGMVCHREPLDGAEDVEFWAPLQADGLHGSPLYFRPFLDRRPDRVAAVMTLLARAAPGGVLYHCGGGRDRTGLITLVLLALADVEPSAIAEDYALSMEPLQTLNARLGRPDEQPVIDHILAARGTTAAAAVQQVAAELDAETYLRRAGVSLADVTALRARLEG